MAVPFKLQIWKDEGVGGHFNLFLHYAAMWTEIINVLITILE
jgi:hypothetical protein